MGHGGEPAPLTDRLCRICQNRLSLYNEADVCMCHPEYIDRLVVAKNNLKKVPKKQSNK